MKNILLLLSFAVFASLFSSCANQDSSTAVAPVVPQVKLPAALDLCLSESGGLGKWNEMKSLTFSFDKGESTEVHKISLKDRKALITRDEVKLGFDGKDVWVSPNKAAWGKGSARFYHNLVFYFFAIPYVLADDGTVYEEVAPKIIDGISHKGVKVSYKDGVGDAPDDYYIAYFNPTSGLVHLLLYTVTYYNGEPNEKYKAIIYEDWQESNGMRVPLQMSGYKYENDTLGEKRYERIFKDVVLSKESFDDSIFQMPNEAEIDPLVQH